MDVDGWRSVQGEGAKVDGQRWTDEIVLLSFFLVVEMSKLDLKIWIIFCHNIYLMQEGGCYCVLPSSNYICSAFLPCLTLKLVRSRAIQINFA
jgi:hypothetical protein